MFVRGCITWFYRTYSKFGLGYCHRDFLLSDTAFLLHPLELSRSNQRSSADSYSLLNRFGLFLFFGRYYRFPRCTQRNVTYHSAKLISGMKKYIDRSFPRNDGHSEFWLKFLSNECHSLVMSEILEPKRTNSKLCNGASRAKGLSRAVFTK